MNESTRFVRQGIKTLKAGQKQRARALFEKALALDERNEMAWLWMSATTGDLQEQEICLENVLTINPDNLKAQKGLKVVRKKIAAAAPPPPPEPEPEPLLQTPASWHDEELDLEPFTTDEATSSLALAERDAPSAVIFSGAASARTKRVKRKGRSLLDQAALSVEAAPRSRGMAQLGSAWLSALVFDGKNSYAAELPVATIGRTMVGVVIASIVATGILAIGFFASLTIMLNVMEAEGGLPVGGLVVGGTNYAAQAAVISAPFLVIFFFALCFGMYLAAKLFGTQVSFYDHAHLFSIAYAPTIITLAIIATMIFIVIGVILGNVNFYPNSPTLTEAERVSLEQAYSRIAEISPFFKGLLSITLIYSIIVWAHALGSVHRNGIIMGIITAVMGLVISIVCVIPVTCRILSGMMSM